MSERPNDRSATYSIEAEHRSEVICRVVIFEGICSKTELGESCAKKDS